MRTETLAFQPTLPAVGSLKSEDERRARSPFEDMRSRPEWGPRLASFVYRVVAVAAIVVPVAGCAGDPGASVTTGGLPGDGGAAPGTTGMATTGTTGMATTGTTGMATTGTAGTPGGTTGSVVSPTDAPFQEPEECGAIRQDAPEARGGVDVVFIRDTSESMLHAELQVAANLAGFIASFENSVTDTRVVMVTNVDPAAGTAVQAMSDRYLFVRSAVDSRALYTVALDQFPAYRDFLRPNAAVQFVMITDDNDVVPSDSFRSQMEALLGKPFTQHAIASENVNGAACRNSAALLVQLGLGPVCDIAGIFIPGGQIPAVCGASAIGEAYYSLAASTGGVTASVCQPDWTGVFEQLKGAVIAATPLPCDYALSDVQTTSVIDPEQVGIRFKQEMLPEEEFGRASSPAACAEHRAWYYDDPVRPTTLSLCPAACQAVQGGGSIELAFGCAPTVVF